LIERVSSNYGGSWEADWLTDENPETGWASEKDAKGPFEIVISLPERSEIRRLSFDTAHAEAPERTAKDVDILVSDQSATAGFTLLASVVPRIGEDNQSFAPPAPKTGRWVKLVVKSSHGSTEYAEIMDARAYGIALTDTPTPNVSGTYNSLQFGLVHVRQDGAQLTGCYDHKGGRLQGGLDGHLMRLRWSEEDNGEGPAVMVLTRDGKAFKGFWMRDGETVWNSGWDLTKISGDVGSCAHWKPANANAVTSGLAATGRMRLYGINFDTDRDTLRPDAAPALQQILAALTANPAWHIVVEGHTDATGTSDHNRDLSQRRAASVKAHLVKAGIAADRIEATGFGPDKPVAPNETSLGRAQNRRVELAKQ
jgi:OOP family OmpA-OmpF porin